MVRYIGKLCGIILAVLPVYLLLRRPWKRKSQREWGLGAFALFTAGLLALALEGEYDTPARMIGQALLRLRTGERIQPVPFRTICGFFRNYIFDGFMINIVGNVVMFLPWGFGLVSLWEENRKPLRFLLFAIGLPFLIECSQLFIGRNTDVDDLILNFTGGCLGAAVYFISRKLRRTCF